MFGESRSIKPEEDNRPAGFSPRVSPSSRQRPTRISSSRFSSTMARMPEQPRKALGKGSESNNTRKSLTRMVERAGDEGAPDSRVPGAEEVDIGERCRLWRLRRHRFRH